MKDVTDGKILLDLDKERKELEKLLNFIKDKLNYKIFRGANGVFSSFQYDAIMINLQAFFDYYKNNETEFLEKADSLKTNKNFRKIVQKSQAKDKIEKLIKIGERIFKPA